MKYKFGCTKGSSGRNENRFINKLDGGPLLNTYRFRNFSD